ncbi:MAG: DEAD/DEAH box helicase [Candidatus Rokubacteria bacterium]|nr:DEAD/DEAH box helicase [Candidatus Rokubacteria bacterium]
MQDDPLARFSLPVRTWFSRRFSAPTDPQRAGWPAIASGTHTLITAPTGSGKTLAAFLFSLDHLVQLGERGELTDAVHVLYVSPLKALNNDIARNLAEPLAGIREAARELGVALPERRAAVRTGDTPAPDRTAMARRPPHILITTPESLFILLASERWRAALATVRYLIVDEIHAVAGSKRGVHLSLSLERLAALAETPPLRIGLSATVEPVEEIARFLVGVEEPEGAPRPCRVVDVGRRRDLDLAVVAPLPELGAVATNPVWEATYARLAELILAHRTTLIFAGSRRLAERIAVRLTERLGPGMVAAHHGSLARRQRQEAEARLKAGAIRAIVATGSLELGIDIGAIDLVCQIESPRALATAIQRIGRSGHWLGATPKGRLFALTRDDLLECAALVRALREGRLDRIETPTNCLDVLAQQVVAAAADQEWEAEALYRLVRRSACYRDLPRGDFDGVLAMEADRLPTEPRGVAPRLYWDRLRSRIRGRRGARLAAVTSGGTIPDTTNYDVYLEPAGIKLGEVEEDFAQESMRGDIFTLGNASWRILRVQRGRMVVESAAGLPPTIPFWHGELPGRTAELSGEVSRLRRDLEARLDDPETAAAWLGGVAALEPAAARIAIEYVARQRAAAGVVPTTETLLAERFFDALGGTQVVLHAPFGMRVTRAWGLALAKRICRSFNFEIQSAATDDAILLSLGVRHSFPLETIWRFLAPETIEETLVQALLAAPLFETRFRHAAVRALLILRQQGGRRVPAYLQRLRATDLLAACFPAQQACLDNRAADLDIPVADHPLVHETLRECLTEALDLGRLRAILEEIRTGAIRTVARELPVPSPFAHKILAAWDYAFLDDAPREERRSRTVQTHRGILGELAGQQALDGTLDPAAAGRVAAEVGHLAEGSRARDPDELVELLKEMGPLTAAEVAERADGEAGAWLETLAAEGRVIRAGRGAGEPVWIATEILPLCRAAYPGLETEGRPPRAGAATAPARRPALRGGAGDPARAPRRGGPSGAHRPRGRGRDLPGALRRDGLGPPLVRADSPRADPPPHPGAAPPGGRAGGAGHLHGVPPPLAAGQPGRPPPRDDRSRDRRRPAPGGRAAGGRHRARHPPPAGRRLPPGSPGPSHPDRGGRLGAARPGGLGRGGRARAPPAPAAAPRAPPPGGPGLAPPPARSDGARGPLRGRPPRARGARRARGLVHGRAGPRDRSRGPGPLRGAVGAGPSRTRDQRQLRRGPAPGLARGAAGAPQGAGGAGIEPPGAPAPRQAPKPAGTVVAPPRRRGGRRGPARGVDLAAPGALRRDLQGAPRARAGGPDVARAGG